MVIVVVPAAVAVDVAVEMKLSAYRFPALSRWARVSAVAVVLPVALGAELDQVVPSLVSTLPVVPGETACKAPVPFPKRTLFNAKVVDPVPPLPTGSVPVTSTARSTDWSLI
jgi:hypothetical protein